MIVEHDIRSAQQVNRPKYLLCAHQTKNRTSAPDEKINIAIFDNLNLRKHQVELDSLRNPTESELINYEQNDYIEQYKDIKLFFEENIGEPFLIPFISYPDMKTKYPIGIIDLSHQSHHITPKKFQLFQEHGADPDNATRFLIFFRRK